MKSFVTFFSALLITVASLAQNSTITVVNPGGQLFFTSLNGVQQHSQAYADVKIASLTTGSYEVRLTFQDGKTTELNKKILLEKVGDYIISVSGKGKSRTLKFATAASAKKMIPGKSPVVNYRANDQVPYSDKTSASVDVNVSPEVPDATSMRFATIGDFTKTYDPSDTLPSETHNLAYRYFSSSNWPELENLFTKRNINGGWPPNRGFINYHIETLQPGTKIDRYGGYTDAADGQFHDKGTFASPMGASFGSRALPASTQNKPYTKYVVLKPIPNVRTGEAIPWFGEPGMGIQYELPENIDDLLKEGYIQKIQ